MKDNFEFRESISSIVYLVNGETLSLLTSGWNMITEEELYSMWSIVILVLVSFYSPWTFNKANPKERPNKVIEKQITAVVTISGLAYGKIDLINSIIFGVWNIIKKLNN